MLNFFISLICFWNIFALLTEPLPWLINRHTYILSVPCEQWFLQAGRYASMGKKPLRATVCFSIEHARPRDDYEYPTTRRQRELQQNNRFNKQNNNFARASRFYFCISLPFLHDYDVKMPNFVFNVNKERRNLFFFSLLNLQKVPWNSTPFGFAYIWQSK